MQIIDIPNNFKIINNTSLFTFIYFTFLDGYLNSSYGESALSMFHIFYNYDNFININIFKDYYVLENLNVDKNITLFGDQEKIYINFVRENHTAKLLLLKKSYGHGTEIIVINSGYKFFNFVVTGYISPKDIHIVARDICSVDFFYELNSYISTSSLKIDDYDEFSLKFCPLQMSGTCAYFSTLYSILAMIYNKHRRDTECIKYKADLKLFAQSIINDFCENGIDKFKELNHEKIEFLHVILFILKKYNNTSNILKIRTFINNIFPPLFSIKNTHNLKNEPKLSDNAIQNISNINNFDNYNILVLLYGLKINNSVFEVIQKLGTINIILFVEIFLNLLANKKIYGMAVLMDAYENNKILFTGLTFNSLSKIYIGFIRILEYCLDYCREIKINGYIFLLLCDTWEYMLQSGMISKDYINDNDSQHTNIYEELTILNLKKFIFPKGKYYQKTTYYLIKYAKFFGKDIFSVNKDDDKFFQPIYDVLYSKLFLVPYKTIPYIPVPKNIGKELNLYPLKSREFTKLIFVICNNNVAIDTYFFKKNRLYAFPKDKINNFSGYFEKGLLKLVDITLGDTAYKYQNSYYPDDCTYISYTSEYGNHQDGENINDINYLNPFDLNIYDDNQLDYILNQQLSMIAPKIILETDSTQQKYNFYLDEKNNFYENSKKIFIENIKRINMNKYQVNTIILIYYYCYFYEFDDSNILNSLKMRIEEDNTKKKYIIKNNLYEIKMFEEHYGRTNASFFSVINTDILKDNILSFFGNFKIFVDIKNIQITNDIISFNKNGQIYTTSIEEIKENFMEKYNIFTKDNVTYGFSKIFPDIIFRETPLLFENQEFKMETILMPNNELIFCDEFINFRGKNRDLITYYGCKNYSNESYFFILRKESTVKLYVNGINEIINDISSNEQNKTFSLINHIIKEANSSIVLTTNKLYYIIKNNPNFIENNMDFFEYISHIQPIYGLFDKEYYLKYIKKIKKSDIFKTIFSNFVFEYDIYFDENGQLLNIELKDELSAFLIYITLSISHNYELLARFMNKFLSLIDHKLIMYTLNNPFSYSISMHITNFINKHYDIFTEIEPYNTFISKSQSLKYYYMKNMFVKEFSNYMNIHKITYRTINNNGVIISQKKCVDHVISSILSKRSILYEIMMGFGKSKLVIPNVVFDILNITNKSLIIITLPAHLINDMYNTLINISLDLGLHFIKKIENTEFDITTINKGVVVISDTVLKHLLLSIKITNYSSDDTILIIDEVDSCINPSKSAFNLKTSVGFLELYIPVYKKIVYFLIKFCIEIVASSNNRQLYCSNFSKCINILFDDVTDVANCICKNTNCNSLNKKNRVLLYILKKLYTVTELLSTENFIYNKDYGLGDDIKLSSYFFAVPYEGIYKPKNDSEFNDIYLTLILTFLIHTENKLRYADYEILFKYIKHTFSSKIYEYGAGFDLIRNNIDQLINMSIDKFIKFCEETPEHTKVIKRLYLEYIIAKKIQYTKTYKNTSFLEIINDYFAKTRIGLTGTPEYIGKIDGNFPVIASDEIFETLPDDVGKSSNGYITQFSSKENDTKNITNLFFNNITKYNKNKSINIEEEGILVIQDIKKNTKINTVIDAGAFFRYKSSREYAIEFIKDSAYKKVFYFENNDDLYYIKNDGIKYIASDNLEKEEQPFLVFFDNVHTRGTDLKLPINSHGIVTISPINDIVNVMQSIYRLRKISNGQTCEFYISYTADIQKNTLSLYDYLFNNLIKYNESQFNELLIQTINANYKWIYKEYVSGEITNYIIPDINEISKDELKLMLNKNYQLLKKINNVCSNIPHGIHNTRLYEQYCTTLKNLVTNSNISRIDTSCGININVNINISLEKQNKIIEYKTYEQKLPFSINNVDFLNVYTIPGTIYKYSYYDYYSYMCIDIYNRTKKIKFDELFDLFTINDESVVLNKTNEVQ